MTNNRHHSLGVIERAIEENRLPHALLLKGRSPQVLQHAAEQVSARLLDVDEAQVIGHPDFFHLQAKNKMRRISVDETRELIRNIQHSPSAGNRKVALVQEVDLMNKEAANAFLKTLEEPPLNTNILLTTARPYALLDTIVSRCLGFWFHEPLQEIQDESWNSWKERFKTWLVTLTDRPKEKVQITERIYQLYGLLDGFKSIMESLSSSQWEIQKEKLPASTPEENLVAMEVGFVRGIRTQMFGELEEKISELCVHTIDSSKSADAIKNITRRYENSVKELESLKGLLEVNLADSKMLEVYFLKLLRIWSY